MYILAVMGEMMKQYTMRLDAQNHDALMALKKGKHKSLNSVLTELITFYNKTLVSKGGKRRDPKDQPKVEANLSLPEVVTKKEPSKSWQVWEAYRDAFKLRYGSEPIHNSKQMAHCKQLISRLGLDLAIEVARFYLTVNDQWQLRRSHDLGSLVKDCEAFARRMEIDATTFSSDYLREAERASDWDLYLKKLKAKTSKENINGSK